MYTINNTIFDQSLEKYHILNKNGFLVFDDFLEKSAQKDVLDFINILESAKNKNSKDRFVPWPWELRTCKANNFSLYTGAEDIDFEALWENIKQQYEKDYQNRENLYYWFLFFRIHKRNLSALGKNSETCGCRENIANLEPASTQKCPLCGVWNTIGSDKFIHLMNKITSSNINNNYDLILELTRFDEYSFLSYHTDCNTRGPVYDLTIIYYVGNESGGQNGGELEFVFGGKENIIEHRPNRLIIFKPTAETLHTIRPIKKGNKYNRYAISGWFMSSK